MNNPAPLKSVKLRVNYLLILLACAAFVAGGCNKAANTNSTNSSTTNTNSTVTNTTTPATTTSSSSLGSSPIAAYKAFQEANKKKDYEAVKRRFSKASLEMLTDEAKQQNKTLDQLVKDQVDKGTSDEEVSNEKIIDSENATVDLKNNNSTVTLPMVKEDGEWKIAYDKFFKQMQEAFDKMSNDMKKSENRNSDNDNQ